jgi:NADPH-dependent glutamate synthase beta subunit-like oxidoreductase/NAD(P)H-flavin reductase
MTTHPFKLPRGIAYPDLFSHEGLKILDDDFLKQLHSSSKTLHKILLSYRKQNENFSRTDISDFIIDLAPHIEKYIATIFNVEQAVSKSQSDLLKNNPVFRFKQEIIIKLVKKQLNKPIDTHETFSGLLSLLQENCIKQECWNPLDIELSIARLACSAIDKENQPLIDTLILWSRLAFKTEEGTRFTQYWPSFHLPKRIDPLNYIPLQKSKASYTSELETNTFRERDGFDLTDPRMNPRAVMNEIDYCVYCHKNEGDFCSKGFPEKKSDPQSPFRKNALDITLTGCPLDEKISEMHMLKRDGYLIGALSAIMLDNPMCPMTGHRICNDCMKACIYQKFDPVNIPEIETSVLTDVLSLPYGVEIYDLLTRWNPLRRKQWIQKPDNHKKVLVAGMGPAGFTIAHHLLQEGCTVMGIDGLKIEPLQNDLISSPIRSFSDISEKLSSRLMAGFGGVAEYGITVRWDKNFLKLIYISLLRRKQFRVFGNVRFGGTITIDKAKSLGFDHLVIAVGAGFPKAIPIPGSLVPGMRQANDFLMALQLTGAAKAQSLTNLQIRLPAIVIGGGLTGVDTATELQAYYIKQIEKVSHRVNILKQRFGEHYIDEQLDPLSQEILHENLRHANELAEERALAKKESRTPRILKLIRSWGGVTIVYRKRLQDSPAYINNYEELQKALEEGIYYAECLEPTKVNCDPHGYAKEMEFVVKEKNSDGNWISSDKSHTIHAKSILIATGAQLNIAYAFEHQGELQRAGIQYQRYDNINNALHIASGADHCKDPNFGPFTSYQKDNFRVTFIGDTHPVFHGNVVRAIASGMRTYPKVMEALSYQSSPSSNDSSPSFLKKMAELVKTYVIKITPRNDQYFELTLKAPLITEQFEPGQFFRLQSYEAHAPIIENTRIQTESIALLACDIARDKKEISFIVRNQGASRKLLKYLSPGSQVALMGPTGVRSKISNEVETVLIVGSEYSIAQIRTYGPALRAKGNKVLYLLHLDSSENLFCQDEIEASCDLVIWSSSKGSLIPPRRENDKSFQGTIIDSLVAYGKIGANILLQDVDRLQLIGDTHLLRAFQQSMHTTLAPFLTKNPKIFGSVYSSMQCMLKGVCAQCLQWQIDPETGQRTKAVFACSWQDQPLEMIDCVNLDERLSQNRLQEKISELWLDHLLETHKISL